MTRRDNCSILTLSGGKMKAISNAMMETPIYGLSEAAQYLRVPLNTLRYWVQGEALSLLLSGLQKASRLGCRS